MKPVCVLHAAMIERKGKVKNMKLTVSCRKNAVNIRKSVPLTLFHAVKQSKIKSKYLESKHNHTVYILISPINLKTKGDLFKRAFFLQLE
jgi:hypothetical protein